MIYLISFINENMPTNKEIFLVNTQFPYPVEKIEHIIKSNYKNSFNLQELISGLTTLGLIEIKPIKVSFVVNEDKIKFMRDWNVVEDNTQINLIEKEIENADGTTIRPSDIKDGTVEG